MHIELELSTQTRICYPKRFTVYELSFLFISAIIPFIFTYMLKITSNDFPSSGMYYNE